MTRRSIVAVIVLCLVAASSRAIRAEVRADEKTHVEFAGMLGKVVNLFGGKAAREGTTSTVAVKGNRKATLNEATGQIVDLAEEKIYDLDMKRKSYKVTTFDEIRRQMEEARKKAEQEAERDSSSSNPHSNATNEKQKEVEVDFTVKNTGEKKTINGFDTHQAIATATVREKGKTLEQSGGLVMTTDMWLGPKVAAMKDITDFDLKYAQKLYGPAFTGITPQQMATAMAMYPGMKAAMAKMAAEGNKLEGTPILTTFTMESVKSEEQMAEEARQQASEDSSSKPTSVGGLLGGFAKKAAANKMNGGDAGSKQRSAFMSGTNEVLKIVTDVTESDVAVPAGFKENK
jgi:hypothetical protein